MLTSLRLSPGLITHAAAGAAAAAAAAHTRLSGKAQVVATMLSRLLMTGMCLLLQHFHEGHI
jgi:hypothetical protein